MGHWLAIVAFAAAAAAQAQPATLRVMGFAGSANLPIFIAQEKGLFAARGLKVDLAPAPNSTTQIAVLRNAPADSAAEAAGFVRLASSAGVLEHYQGSVGAAQRAWARQHGDTLVRYIAAHIAALDWLYAPANRAEALRIVERRLGVDARNAERSYTELLAQGSLARKAALDVDGIRAVLALRRRFAPSPPPSSDPARYYDLSYYEKALSR